MKFSVLSLLMTFFSLWGNAEINYYYEDPIPNYSAEVYDVQNVPFFVPYILSVAWDPDTKVLPFCVETNNMTVNKEIIESAFDNINMYLYTGDLDTTALYLYVDEYTNKTCPDEKLTISIVKERNQKKAPGYCSRRFLNGNAMRPTLLYVGCDITLNACALQSSATFYNVLLHELLHVIGLDHPDEKRDSVMSYGVRAKDQTLKVLRQDDFYITIRPEDKQNIDAIIMRDFPDSRLPIIPIDGEFVPSVDPKKHISGDDKYAFNTYVNVDECWEQNVVTVTVTDGPTFVTVTDSPTAVTVKPTVVTDSPTVVTDSPTVVTVTDNPTFVKTNNQDKGQGRKGKGRGRKGKGKGKGKGRKGKGKGGGGGSITINNKVQPDIEIDVLKGDIVINSDISPVIRYKHGSFGNRNVDNRDSFESLVITNNVDPLIRILKSGRMKLVDSP